jgi:hypothetical protein
LPYKLKNENCKNEFWKDVLHAWQYILSKTTTYDSWASFLHNPIWYNNKLKFNHTYFSYKDWYRKGVRIVNDLVKENGEFYSFAEFERKYNININFLKYQYCIHISGALFTFQKTSIFLGIYGY